MKLRFLALCLAVLAIGGAMTLALAVPAVLGPPHAASPEAGVTLAPSSREERP